MVPVTVHRPGVSELNCTRLPESPRAVSVMVPVPPTVGLLRGEREVDRLRFLGDPDALGVGGGQVVVVAGAGGDGALSGVVEADGGGGDGAGRAEVVGGGLDRDSDGGM